jgi:hypothetical protein
MAQLTASEQQSLRARGIWVNEKCDRLNCNGIISYISWLGCDGAVYCSEQCRDAMDGQSRRRKAKPETATPASTKTVVHTTATTKGDKLLGIAKIGTTLANVLQCMLDGKWHTKDSMLSCKVIPKDSIGWRWTLLQRAGASATQPFEIEVSGDKARLSFLNGQKGGSTNAKVVVQDVPVAD